MLPTTLAAKLRWLSVLMIVSCVVVSEELPSITATYVVERLERGKAAPSSFQWQLHRSASCVIANDSDSRVSEQWNRDEQGRIWYKRIFHKERKVIEYQPADLKIGGVEARWNRIAAVIDPAELQAMTLQSESGTFDGRSVSVYRGLRQGAQWEIAWLAGEQLPERIRIEGEGGRYLLQLRKLTIETTDAVSCRSGDLAGYETIDFADIGDRQGDPFIEGLMKYEGFSHGHGH
jgi:hypothetical protein